jgi:hypothetical protein
MPFEYSRDDASRRIRVTATGQISFDEVQAVLDRQAAEGCWGHGTLWDARGSVTTPSASDVRDIVLYVGELTTRYGPRGPVAIVTSRRGVRDMAGLYAELGCLTALSVRVFDSPETATAWLDHEVVGREPA